MNKQQIEHLMDAQDACLNEILKTCERVFKSKKESRTKEMITANYGNAHEQWQKASANHQKLKVQGSPSYEHDYQQTKKTYLKLLGLITNLFPDVVEEEEMENLLHEEEEQQQRPELLEDTELQLVASEEEQASGPAQRNTKQPGVTKTVNFGDFQLPLPPQQPFNDDSEDDLDFRSKGAIRKHQNLSKHPFCENVRRRSTSRNISAAKTANQRILNDSWADEVETNPDPPIQAANNKENRQPDDRFHSDTRYSRRSMHEMKTTAPGLHNWRKQRTRSPSYEQRRSQTADPADNSQNRIIEALIDMQRQTNRIFEMSTKRRNYKAPEITVPKFSGRKEEYENWKQLFANKVVRHEMEVEDCHAYLMERVDGKAKEFINHLNIANPQTYQECWRILDQNFYKPKLLFNSHLTNLVNVLQKPASTAEELSDLALIGSKTITYLSTTNATVSQIVAFLLMNGFGPDIMDKFDQEHGTDPSRQIETDEVLSFLRGQIDITARNEKSARETWIRPAPEPKIPPVNNFQGTMRPYRSQPTREVNAHVTNNFHTDKKPRKPYCGICKSNEHALESCEKAINATDRIQLAREHKICVFCTKHQYTYGKECKSRQYLICGICKRDHITFMCPQAKRSKVVQVHATLMSEEVDAPAEANLIDFEETEVTTHYQQQGAPTDDINAVMPTVNIKIKASDGSTVAVRALMDHCSTTSYITDELVKSLKLTTNDARYVSRGVNGSETKCAKKTFVTMQTGCVNQPFVEFLCLVIPSVTSQLPMQEFEIPEELSGYVLADPTFNVPNFVGMLLGQNVNNHLYDDEAEIKKVGGFTLMQSNLGWVVQGCKKKLIITLSLPL